MSSYQKNCYASIQHECSRKRFGKSSSSRSPLLKRTLCLSKQYKMINTPRPQASTNCSAYMLLLTSRPSNSVNDPTGFTSSVLRARSWLRLRYDLSRLRSG